MAGEGTAWIEDGRARMSAGGGGASGIAQGTVMRWSQNEWKENWLVVGAWPAEIERVRLSSMIVAGRRRQPLAH